MEVNLACQYFFSFPLVLGGCGTFTTVLRNPPPVIPASQEVESIRQSLSDPAVIQSAAINKTERNTYISERIYAIDLQYTAYEAALTHSTEEGTLGSALINPGITGTTSVLNVPQTNKILSAIATGVTGASQTFDKDVLLSKAIQDLQTQMRADRNTQGAKILANMQCSVKQYPRTVSNAEQTAQAKKDSVNPSPAVSTLAQAKLVTDADVDKNQAKASNKAVRAAAIPDEDCPAPAAPTF
jgi:hypothetical protein